MKNGLSISFRKLRSPRFAVGLFLLVLTGSLNLSSAQTQIFKANNTNALDQGNSWVGGVVPNNGNIIVYNNTNTASTTGTIGAGLSVAGILFSTNPGTSITISNAAAGTGVLGLGSSGIDIRASTNRLLTISTPISLNADQTWYTGLTNANTAMITASGVISGTGRLTVGGASSSSNQYVSFSALNTYSGGLTLNAGGALRVGATGATASGTTVTASSLGTGPLIINGGTIFGNSGQLASSSILLNGDFSVNQGAAGGINVRLTIGGGFDLGGQTRTVSVGGYTNIFTGANGILTSGQEKFRIMPITTTAPNTGPSNTVANGTLRLIRDAAGGNGVDFVSFNIGAGGVFFSEGAGLTIGNGVVTTFGTAIPFGGANLPHLAVESGGYFNLSDAANLRPASIRSLSGSGIVTTLATNTNGLATLTISNPVSDSSNFSGQISDGVNFTNLVGTNTLQGRLAIVKSGSGTQILSGSNAMTGTITLTNNGGELRFTRKVSLYAGNTSLWTNLAVNSGATLGLSLGGAEGFASADLDVLVGNSNILKAGSKLALEVSSSNSPVTLSTVLSNSANTNGVPFTKTGEGRLILSGYTGTLSNALTVTGGTLQFSNLSTYSGSPSLSGGAVLDLGGATFPIPNTVTLTNGSMVNFNPGVSDPFAPTSNVSYTGFSFAVTNLNDGTNGTRTFTLANSILTVSGSAATNGFTISGASNGLMRFTGATTGQSDTNTSKGQISVQGAATLEFASNSVFDSYRPLSINSASNPTVLVSGGAVSNLSYVIFGQASTNTGTLRVTSGSISVANPNPSGNGLYFGQNGGAGTLNLEGGSISTPSIKVQSGTANINLTGGTLNIVTTNASGNPASATQLTSGGTLNFNMTGGSVIATNSKFNLSPQNATNTFTVAFNQNSGLISSMEMSAGPGTFVMNGGTNVSSGGMYVGDNSNGVATFTQNGGLVQILGQTGSSATNDLVIGNGSGTGTYLLNGGVLEVYGKIRKNSGTSSLVLNGGVLRYTNSTNQGAFISSLVNTTVGSNGAIFEITDGSVTNTIQADLNDISGQTGKLIKRGTGALAIARTNLAYSGSTQVEDGKLIVTGTNFTAHIASNAISMIFSNPPVDNVSSTNTYSILPANLEGGTTSIVAPQLAANQPITFDPATGTAQVVTTALGSSTISVTGLTSYTYNGNLQGPDTSSTSGSTGAVTYEYTGTGGTSYGPSADKPTGAGSYTVTASLAGDSNYQGATSSPFSFTIEKATPVITVPPTASAITVGQTLASSILSEGTASVAGSFAFTTPSTAPSVGTANQEVTFTPDDTANYATATTTVSVTVNPAGESIANFLPPGTPTNAETLGKYLIGGATNFNAASERPVVTANSSNLVLTAIIRTNDTNYSSNQVVGQWVTSLPQFSGLAAGSNEVLGTPSANQTNVPTGFERRDFTVNRTNGTNRLFLRLKATQ